MWRSPKSDAFQPPKEQYATGTGIGTLIPTIPACASNWNWRATPPSRVKIAVPFPYGFSFTSRTASLYVATRVTPSTGPKISSLYASISGVTLSSSETPRKKPSPSGADSRPSATTSAPWLRAPSMYPATLSRCSRVTSGPISTSGSSPSPTLIFGSRSLIAATSRSPASPTATTCEIAMQRSPAEPYAALTAASAAMSMSASGRTIMWFFAPPSACTRLPVLVPFSYTYFAIGVEPTNDTAAMSGCSSTASTATLSPCTTLKTPSGTPASCSSSATYSDADGSFSDGFKTKVLPQANAGAHIHMGTIAGKLNGVIPATTPSGWRIE